MTPENRETIIKIFLRDINSLLTEASGVASIGSNLVDMGATEQAVQKMFDVEPLLHDARTLLNAAILQYRHENEA